MKITDTEITCLKEKGISTVLYFHDQLEEKLAKKQFKAYPPKRGRQTPDLDAHCLSCCHLLFSCGSMENFKYYTMILPSTYCIKPTYNLA